MMTPAEQGTYTVYEGRQSKGDPVATLLDPVAYDLNYANAHDLAWKMTMKTPWGCHNSDIFYTARLNKQSGPVRKWNKMPWGEMVPDFS